MTIKLHNLFFALPALALIAACGGGSGGGSGPSTGAPGSESIADLAEFAADGQAGTNGAGVRTSTNTYVVDGERRTVVLSGSQNTGLLAEGAAGSTDRDYSLIGADTSANTNIRGEYVADLTGSVRMRDGAAMAPVSGTASVGMSAATGEWAMGADMWTNDGENGIFVAAENGTVEGNTMVFDRADSSVVAITPNGVFNTAERVGTRAVFSDNGDQVFGTITGNNANSGFSVDAGFAGSRNND